MRLAGVAVLALCACATYVDVKRSVPPYIELSGPPGVGLLSIGIDDNVMARLPPEFSNYNGIVFKVVKDYFAGESANMTVIDYTGLGFSPQWIPTTNIIMGMPAFADARLPTLPKVPASVQTPLVTVVRIVDWRVGTDVSQDGKTKKEVAHVALVFSTWTRDGHLVRHEWVSAGATGGSFGASVYANPNNPELSKEFYRAYPETTRTLMTSDHSQLFWTSIKLAVAYHYYAFVPHQLTERFSLDDAEPYKDGVLFMQQGKYDAALDAWRKITLADPNASGAFYNLAVAYLAKGDEQKADEMLTQAVALHDGSRAELLQTSLRTRMRMRQTVAASSPP
jgi:hypothetical protein